MGRLFEAKLDGWESWSRVFQAKELFVPMAREIFARHGLEFEGLENLAPGTNAVFRSGGYVVKIAAPEEAGFGDISEEELRTIDETGVDLGEADWIDLGDIATEIFVTRRANELGAASPELVASGTIEDSYSFDYLVTRFIGGEAFDSAAERMTPEEKRAAGRELRSITDLLNRPCPEMERVRGADILRDPTRHRRWKVYPREFRQQRMEYLFAHERDFGERVLVHGDLCGDNIIVSSENGIRKMYIIDFADSVLAPKIYEQALIAVELFRFDPDLLHGYFGDMPRRELAQLCLDGMLMHDFGADIAKHNIAPAENMHSLEDMLRAITDKLENY